MLKIARCLLVLFFGVSVGQAAAQETTATILGTATDQSGGVLPGVSITVRNLGTSLTRAVVTDSEGRYRVPALPVGSYEIAAQLSGFQSVVRSGIVLTVATEAVVNLMLRLGDLSEQLTVTGEAPLVETTTSVVSNLVTQQQLQALPLNGRDFSQLALLQPGVVMSRGSANTANVGQGIKISVAGARPAQNLFTLDGTAYNDALNNTPASANGVMTGVETIQEFRVVTNTMSAEYGRAGGGVFNVITKSGTNAFGGSVFEFFRADALDAKNFFDEEKPDFQRSQFGGSLGGPLVKNKTFFFSSYEGLREHKGITQVATVLDDAARTGILPGRAAIDVPAGVRPYVDLYPVANGPQILDPAGRPTGLAEYKSVLNRHSNQDFAMVRVDHTFSASDSIFARYLLDDSTRDEPVNYAEWPNITKNRKHVLTAEERRLFSANVINELRFGFTRSSPTEDVNPLNPRTDLSFVPGLVFGEVNVTGITDIGTDRGNPRIFGQDLYQVSDNLYIVRSRHAIKTGFDIQHFRFDGLSETRTRGRLRFRSVSDFLSGITQQFEIARPGSDFERHLSQSLLGVYAQDDYKLANRLTLNLGVRYEFVTTPKERDGKISNLRNILDPEVTIGGALFKNPTMTQLAPRVGFAWDVKGDGKTAVRSGFGIFHDEPLFNLYRSPVYRGVPFADRAVIARPTLPVNLATLGSAGVPETESITYDLKSTYMLQYNVNVQQELPWQSSISLAYMGSRGKNLSGTGDVNTAIPQIVDGQEFFPVGSVRRNPNFNVVRAILQGFRSEYNGFTLGFIKRRTHGLQLQTSYTYGRSHDNRSGNGGRLEYRNGQARTFDPYNLNRDWGRSDYDIRHNLVANLSYDLPFGTSNFGQGWQINAVGTFASGVPFSPVIPGDPDRDATTDNVGRPNVVPGVSTVPTGGRGPDMWFNPAAFVFPGAGFRGNAGRNILEGPGLAVVDLAIVKTQRLSGRMNLQFRVELFNVLNRTNFDLPANDPDGAAVFDDQGVLLPTAGRIFITSTDAREAQIAIRLSF
jgi:Carboxypeptidase regulatory-like domain/TonB-dependent Receptor Plug Domain/TonB dependent receptor-like, beta-barrel